jgi:amino acid adenylation domain-containing protein
MKKEIIEEYWNKKLAGIGPGLGQPLIKYPKKRRKDPGFHPEPIVISIPAEVSEELGKISKNNDIALFILSLSGLSLLLDRYSEGQDFLVGTLNPGETNDPGNLMFCRVRMSELETFKDLVNHMKNEVQETINYGKFTTGEIIKESFIKNSVDSRKAYDVAFIYNPLQTRTPALDDFKLVLELKKEETCRVIKIDYQPEYCSPGIISRFCHNFIHFFNHLSAKLEKQRTRIPILCDHEKEELLNLFNDTQTEITRDFTLCLWLDNQMERLPDQIAIEGKKDISSINEQDKANETIQVTYQQLNKRAQQLAGELQKRGAGLNKCVAIIMERTVELITGMIAILKSGSIYLPIGPEYPIARMEYMMKDIGVDVVLADGSVTGTHPGCISIDIQNPGSFMGDTYFLPSCRKPGDLIYVSYTSGSTGYPKGVMIQDRSVVNFIKSMSRDIPMTRKHSLLSLTTVSFDIFGLEIYLPLTSGARMVLGSTEEQLNSLAAATLLEKKNITHFQLTPSRLQLFLNVPGAADSLRRLEYLLVGGESLSESLLEGIRPFTKGKIFNLYGPTETTIWSTIKDLTTKKQVNIGKPILNTRITILSESGLLQPIGVLGEICISGEGLARGYLNRVELTEEKFTWNPMNEKERLYHTGDLGRWTTGGEIEILGRVDSQVKIRGFRIEPKEIEHILLRDKKVMEAVVIDYEKEEGQMYLCAFLKAEEEIPTSQLRDQLSRILPDYMVPSYFMFLDKLPLTPNGKIDRKALPKPEIKSGATYVAPGNEKEKIIAELWKEVLKIEKVGIHDNFFELGGNSLSIIQLNVRLKEVLNADIPVVTLFQYPTVHSMFFYLEGSHDPEYSQEDLGKPKTEESMTEAIQFFEDMRPLS